MYFITDLDMRDSAGGQAGFVTVRRSHCSSSGHWSAISAASTHYEYSPALAQFQSPKRSSRTPAQSVEFLQVVGRVGSRLS